MDAILAWNEVVFPGSHTAVAEALAGPALSRERRKFKLISEKIQIFQKKGRHLFLYVVPNAKSL